MLLPQSFVKMTNVEIETFFTVQPDDFLNGQRLPSSAIVFLKIVPAPEHAIGNGFACFDPHGDLIDSVVERVPESRLKDVILFDPSDEDFPIGFNILAAHSELEKILLASDLVSIFRRFSTSWGDLMNSILANAVLAFLGNERGGNLLELKRFLIERNFREDF